MSVAVIVGLGALGWAAWAPALDAPMRRAGLWEMSMSMDGGPARNMKMRICTDPTVERRHGMFSSPMARPGGVAGHTPSDCSVQQFNPVPGGIAFKSVCTGSDGPTTTEGTATGDFGTSYHVDIKTQSSRGARHFTQDGKWLGACPADQAPGSMSIVMPDGRTMQMGPGMMGGPGA